MSASYFAMGLMRGMDLGGPVSEPTERGIFVRDNFTPLVRERLATDSIGTAQIVLTGVRLGSEAHIIAKDSTVLASADATGNALLFSIPRYSAGSPNNTVRVIVASLGYEMLDFDYTVTSESASIPVFQRVDRTYKNPT